MAAAYAQSWLLAHYLSSRVTREQVAAYVADVLGGKEPVQAFEALTGKKAAAVEGELRGHLNTLR